MDLAQTYQNVCLLLCAVNVEIEVFGRDFLKCAIRTNAGNRLIKLFSQLGIFLTHSATNARTKYRNIIQHTPNFTTSTRALSKNGCMAMESATTASIRSATKS